MICDQSMGGQDASDGDSWLLHGEPFRSSRIGEQISFASVCKTCNILPGKLTCPPKVNGWKMYFLLK